jgi:uncharacterized membrane protein YccF (DUF307 family)
MISLLLNLAWIVLGGLWMAVGWLIAGVVLALTIVGLPWARAAFRIGSYTLLPFGYQAVDSRSSGIATGPIGVFGNVLWFVVAGWWLAAGHVITALLLATTIIGIPFAWAHLKLARLALWPIGKEIVPVGRSPAARPGRTPRKPRAPARPPVPDDQPNGI